MRGRRKRGARAYLYDATSLVEIHATAGTHQPILKSACVKLTKDVGLYTRTRSTTQKYAQKEHVFLIPGKQKTSKTTHVTNMS